MSRIYHYAPTHRKGVTGARDCIATVSRELLAHLVATSNKGGKDGGYDDPPFCIFDFELSLLRKEGREGKIWCENDASCKRGSVESCP
jgi:hypothetical protein